METQSKTSRINFRKRIAGPDHSVRGGEAVGVQVLREAYAQKFQISPQWKRTTRFSALAEEIMSKDTRNMPIGFWLKVISQLRYDYARPLWDRLVKDPNVQTPVAILIEEWKKKKPGKQQKLI